MNVNQYVSEKLREFRKQTGVKRVELAEYLNISESAYGKLESGITTIDIRRVYYLSKFFKKPFREFLPPLENENSNEQERMVNNMTSGLELLLKEKGELIEHLKSEIAFLRKQLEDK
jgi:transcriptional regulator with XRE-family HTH domain